MKKIIVDIQHIPLQWKGLVEEVEHIMCEYSANPLFESALITYGKMSDMLSPHIIVILKLRDEPESVELSEEIESKLMKVHQVIFPLTVFT